MIGTGVALSQKSDSWRPVCMAGHVGLELTNVEANYPSAKPRGFPRSAPNFGHGDRSRLLQRRGYAARGRVLLGIFSSILHGHWPSCGVAEKVRIGRDLFNQKMIRPRQSQQHHCSICAGLPAKRACVVSRDAEPDRLAPLTPPAPLGLRGVWVMAARCCATLLREVLYVQAQTCALP